RIDWEGLRKKLSPAPAAAFRNQRQGLLLHLSSRERSTILSRERLLSGRRQIRTTQPSRQRRTSTNEQPFSRFALKAALVTLRPPSRPPRLKCWLIQEQHAALLPNKWIC